MTNTTASPNTPHQSRESLLKPISYFKGVGAERGKAFNRLGVYTAGDLLNFFPRAYEDRSNIVPIDGIVSGESVCTFGMVAEEPVTTRIRKGLDVTKTRIVDDYGSITVTYFNQSYIKQNLHIGQQYYFYGRASEGAGRRPELQNPVFESASSIPKTTRCIYSLYNLSAGLSQQIVHNTMRQALDECVNELPELLPRSVRMRYELSQNLFCYENIHFPKSLEELEIARRGLIFEEFFSLFCALEILRQSQSHNSGFNIQKSDKNIFLASVPFKLTNAQQKAVDDIFNDMSSGKPMSRLLQGDVGSGKTVVAAAACWNAYNSGFQSAFMAPTEILASQHYKTLTAMLEPLGMKISLLTGGLKAKEKREVLARLENGDTDLVIGTHSLISEKVTFNSLALIVADEQHRFGVQQRSALAKKGSSPHILVMSATPIPRTLSLIMYGDLDVSVLNEQPPGRTPVKTYLVSENMRLRIYNFIRKLVGEGRQVFIVCPMVEEADDGSLDVKSVKKYAESLQNDIFPDLRIAVVHGKLKAKEKDEIMSDFAAGKYDILVATTVIEVGVDVPNAALMVVEDADRFGLSQLHQLRGRVGRGEHQSYCVLFAGNGGRAAIDRLKAMCRTNNGFEIAEEDLRLRGPGDILGSRQSGLPELKLAAFTSDVELLSNAKEAARELLERDPNLELPENRQFRAKINDILEKNRGTIN